MEKIPRPVLEIISSYAESFYETLLLSLVCKRWYQAISKFNHEVSFQNFPYKMIKPWDPRTHIENIIEHKFLIKNWKMISLDLRNIKINEKLLVKIIFSQQFLLKLNLTNSLFDIKELLRYLDYEKLVKKQVIAEFPLEELKLTNYKKNIIDFKHLNEFFPKIKKLYLGGTTLNKDALYSIILNFKNLEILDTSSCANLKIKNKDDLDSLIENSKIKKIYLNNEANEGDKENLWAKLNSLPSSHTDLESIKSWFTNEIDVNIFPEIYQENDNFISKLDEDFLIEIFELLIGNGLNKWLHRCYLSSLHSYNYCSFLHEAAIYRKMKLFWFLFDKNFPLFHCNGWLLFEVSEIIDGLSSNPSRVYYIPNSMLYEATQYYIKFKDKDPKIFQLIDALTYNKIQFKESKILEEQMKSENSLFIKSLFTAKLEDLDNITLDAKIKQNPLIITAAIRCQPEIIKKILSCGFDVDIENSRGKTALFYAVSKGYNDIIQILCKNNANVNKKDKSGKSSIYKTIKAGNDKAFTLLIQFGADLNCVDNCGLTVLSYAKKHSRKAIIKMIEKENNRLTINRYLHKDAFNESDEILRQA
ncbi:unnamed protein product [Blepharisma stoltei]|uniref:F-box domain-containing protein n=1 Tax=Blepharisma stoltei TaxID=1481888 RepID=A0AAU9K903_9CILI|nr:unnamed protein product [Blepharisma stoltei]